VLEALQRPPAVEPDDAAHAFDAGEEVERVDGARVALGAVGVGERPFVRTSLRPRGRKLLVQPGPLDRRQRRVGGQWLENRQRRAVLAATHHLLPARQHLVGRRGRAGDACQGRDDQQREPRGRDVG